MAVANVVHQDYDLPPNIPTNSISSASNAAERGDGPGLIGGPAHIPPSRRRLSPKGIAKLIGLRFMRTVRRGNLPFLILFFRFVFASPLLPAACTGCHEYDNVLTRV